MKRAGKVCGDSQDLKSPATSGFLSDFGITLSLVPMVRILKKNWGHWKNLGESGTQNFKESDREVSILVLRTSGFAIFW